MSSRRSKDAVNPPIKMEVFFEGVREMRAYLDRDIQDPERRRARLSKVAQELLKPRATRELVRWLAQQITSAVGATAVSVLVRNTRGVWSSLEGVHVPPESALAQVSSADPHRLDDGVLVPLLGVEGVVGALWVEATYELDASSLSLLQAIAGAAGVAIEQGMFVDDLAVEQ